MKQLIVGLSVLLGINLTPVYATSHVNLAIIDSGVDTQHYQLRNNIWTNLVDINENNVDEDKNGFLDDVYGWNFVENNAQVIDYKYLGSFNKDTYLFYDLLSKEIDGKVTDAEKKWIKEKLKDDAFLLELNKFSNFVHGTHVAGIGIQQAEHTKILTVKLIPTEIPDFDMKEEVALEENQTLNDYIKAPLELRMSIAKKFLGKIVKEETEILTNIAKYINGHHSKVANGSFGTGYEGALGTCILIYQSMFDVEPSDDDARDLTMYLLKSMMETGKEIAKEANETLFVFAAGNDGTNNDIYPSHPANIKAPNVMSVAATYQNIELAPFSCYGKNTVDVAAPGVNILSAIPGDDEIKMSGTSQAAPFVSGVASNIQRINPNLHPAQIKKVIMQTVDKKDWLVGIVKSAGVVNSERAYFAAKASLKVSLAKAINLANIEVMDQDTNSSVEDKSRQSVMRNMWVTPIPSQFRFLRK